MLPEYDFSKGVRTRHYLRMKRGYYISIRKDDGTVRREFVPPPITLGKKVIRYFPDSKAVNRALGLIVRSMERAEIPVFRPDKIRISWAGNPQRQGKSNKRKTRSSSPRTGVRG